MSDVMIVFERNRPVIHFAFSHKASINLRHCLDSAHEVCRITRAISARTSRNQTDNKNADVSSARSSAERRSNSKYLPTTPAQQAHLDAKVLKTTLHCSASFTLSRRPTKTKIVRCGWVVRTALMRIPQTISPIWFTGRTACETRREPKSPRNKTNARQTDSSTITAVKCTSTTLTKGSFGTRLLSRNMHREGPKEQVATILNKTFEHFCDQ